MALPFWLWVWVHKEREKFPFRDISKHGLKSLFHLERLFPRPPNAHDGPFFLDVVYRDTAVRYGVDDTHGAQAYSNRSEHLGAI